MKHRSHGNRIQTWTPRPLIISQVILAVSGLPAPVALVMFSLSRDIVGEAEHHRITTATAIGMSPPITGPDDFLFYQTMFG